jgi:hypothetical protein
MSPTKGATRAMLEDNGEAEKEVLRPEVRPNIMLSKRTPAIRYLRT